MKIDILRETIEDNDTKRSKIFALFIQFLVILSLISFSVETLPGLSEQTKKILSYFEIVTVLIFTIEYISRILVARKKMSYVLSFYGITDLIAIVPFYLSLGIDLRSIRILRLLRLFRIFKILRFHIAIERFCYAFKLIRAELLLFSVLSIILIYVSSVGIYFFENPAQPDHFSSIIHCLWWSIVTLTSVGYGDIYPITVGGRIFTSFIVIIGIGIIAVPTGLLASALTKTDNNNG
jgi:voltage-gated potassium channel